MGADFLELKSGDSFCHSSSEDDKSNRKWTAMVNSLFWFSHSDSFHSRRFRGGSHLTCCALLYSVFQKCNGGFRGCYSRIVLRTIDFISTFQLLYFPNELILNNYLKAKTDCAYHKNNFDSNFFIRNISKAVENSKLYTTEI